MPGKFDIIICECINENDCNRELCIKFATMLNPEGHLILYILTSSNKIKEVEHNLLISGFVNTTVTLVKSFECLVENTVIQTDFLNTVTCIQSEKPNYEVNNSIFF